MLPNFLICGVAQSGTSALVASMMQHPEIYMPAKTVPEPHFFLKSWEYAKGIISYEKEWFPDVRGETAVGEKSSSYLFGGADVARRIRSNLPGVRLIVMLRDPGERAWAHYRFSALNGIELLGFEEAILQEPERITSQTGRWAEIQPFSYAGRGMYARQLRQFLSVFQREQMLIVKSESIISRPETAFSELFRFLGVDLGFVPGRVPGFKSLQVRDAALQFACRDMFGDRLSAIVKAIRMKEDPFVHVRSGEEKSMVERMIDNLHYEVSAMPPRARTLLRGLFHDDLHDLKEIVDFPIDDWPSVRGD